MFARNLARPLPAPLSAVLCVLAAGCHDAHEVVVTKPAPPVYGETEPNDDVFGADDFGYLVPGDEFGIVGSVRDDPYDPQDGFAFTAAGPIVVDFVLDAQCACADLDVWLYDPLRDEFVAVYDSPHAHEHGSFTVYGQAFHLVVVSAAGDAPYRLDVRASATYAALAADGPAVSVGAPGVVPVLPRAPSAALEGYRAAQRGAGPPRLVEVYAIDPDAGVVGIVRVPATSR